MKFKMEQEERRETDPLEFREAAPTAQSVGGMLGTKNLLIVIVTMPFVFLVVVMAIIGLVGKPEKASKAETPGVVRSIETVDAAPSSDTAASGVTTNGQRVVLPMPASLTTLASAITLPEGATPGAISLDGDRLALRVDTEDGTMIVIYDLATDQVVKTIPLVEAAGADQPANP